MSVWRLVLREILYRRLNFCLAVLSVLTAVGCLVAVLALLRLHDLRTEELVEAREAEARAVGRKLEDDYRKTTLKLGFNIEIYPKGQNRDFFSSDFAARTMPEEYAQKLANAGVVTINHLQPSLRQKVTWAERKRTVILEGVRDEVPIPKQAPKKPLLDPVARGTMHLGHELHASMGLSRGDRVRFRGKEFTVTRLLPPARRDAAERDSTVWIHLAEAQELLNQPGKINAILALECNCEAQDRLAEVRKEIAQILPDTEVIEWRTEALTRAEARKRAAAEARDVVRREQEARAALRREREDFAAVLVPLVLLGCTVWVGLLAFTNARDRAAEVGILRALGVGAPRVFALFLLRALLVGLLGAVLGYAVGLTAGLLLGEEATAAAVFDPVWLAAVLVAAPVLCALASWVPALLAARQDPAVVLRDV